MTKIVGVLVLATLIISGIGFLHTPTGRSLPIGRKILGLLGVQCPVDTSRLTSSQVEASRLKGVQALRGEARAPERPALAGLTLDVTTEAEAQMWAKSHSISCTSLTRGMRFLKCQNVAPSSLAADPGKTPIQMLTLAFNPENKLVAVDLFRRKLKPQEAARIAKSLSNRLKKELGPSTETMGQFTPSSLEGDSMKTAFVHYRFWDYLALLTVTNIPWSGGIAVHEQYSSTVK